MKIKQYIPIIVILLFSCLLFLGITSYLFFSTDYPEDIPARLGLSLRQGLVYGVVVTILLLLGMGLNALLHRIQDPSRRKWISLGVYLGSLLLCVGLPAIGIAATWFFFSPPAQWQQLPSMTAPAVKIAAAGKDVVIVRADDGDHYYCWTKQLAQCWETVDEPSNPLIENYGGELKTTSNPPGVTPPSDVIDMLGVVYNESAIFYESHYAITSDGHVWYLNRETNNGTAGFASGLLFLFALPLMLGTLTVLAGAGISGTARGVSNRIWREI
ncbi:MAG: hypothetical protein QM730_10995 [Anaerolineales bacterium]